MLANQCGLADEILPWFDDNGTIHLADNSNSVPERYYNESQKRQVTPSREPTPVPVSQAEQTRVPYLQKFTIPFAREDGRLLVDGNINNQTNVRFIVDTGASMTMIPARVASRLGFDPKQGLLIEIAALVGH